MGRIASTSNSPSPKRDVRLPNPYIQDGLKGVAEDDKYGFLKNIAARPAMDDSSSNNCSPMIDHILPIRV